MTTMYRRAALVHDVLAEGDEALVLVNDTLLRIGPLAHELLLAAVDASLPQLVEHCLAAFGPVPDGDATAVVGEAVRELVDKGVLEEIA